LGGFLGPELAIAMDGGFATGGGWLRGLISGLRRC
jgi:hypothetical protein